MTFEIQISSFGPKTLLINWPQQISEKINRDITGFNHLVLDEFGEIIIESVCTFCSLTLYLKEAHEALLIEKIKNLYSKKRHNISEKNDRIWNIPVCYDETFGIDLEKVAKTHSMEVKEIISLHTQPLYHVYFLGFLPGFPYLGGLDERLITPRLKSPRLKIPKGSVAIGNQQTGVYPSDSPGGWNIIGRTPIDFYNKNFHKPVFLNAGDKIKFDAIDLDTYNSLSTRIKQDQWSLDELKSSTNHD